MWRENGLLVAGIPVYNQSSANTSLVTEKLDQVLAKSRRENALLVELCAAAAEGWARIQSAFIPVSFSHSPIEFGYKIHFLRADGGLCACRAIRPRV